MKRFTTFFFLSENYLLGHDSDDDFYGNSGSCEEDREEEEGDEGLSAEGRANFERIMRNSRQFLFHKILLIEFYEM